YDAQMYNPTRLVLAFIKSAVSKGARVANYVEATSLVMDGNHVLGVNALDKRSGREIVIRGKMVLNAAGPWSEWLLEKSLPAEIVDKGVYSRDACFVIKRRFSSPRAIAVQGRTSDPDALLSRPARHLFMVPWRDCTLVGVWHIVWKKTPDQVTVEQEEIASFIDEMNWAYPGLQLSLDDVRMWNAGLVPFGENEEGAENLSYGKRSTFVDHSASDKIDGLVTLIGVRYTTARGDSSKAIDLICSKLRNKSGQASTETTPLVGGDIEDFDAFANRLHQQQKIGLSLDCVRALAHNHGTEATRIIDMAAQDKIMAQTLGNTHVLKAELVNAVENEMAFTLADVVFRRTDLATGGNPGDDVLRDSAEFIAQYTGWEEHEINQQINDVQCRFPAWLQ
ncbi:MAG: FAD-dependent oxidoreductase, partial [Gammaproteobacteria bacterium]|nr:FAD-dependent oxidoreductase [Gammaproteobacteria bacterium]